jgi:hypothetical protein
MARSAREAILAGSASPNNSPLRCARSRRRRRRNKASDEPRIDGVGTEYKDDWNLVLREDGMSDPSTSPIGRSHL